MVGLRTYLVDASQALINHEELLAELSKALTQIAEALPRVEIHAHLYESAAMRKAVSLLYAHVIKFFHRAMSWFADCKDNKFKAVVSSIFRPYELRFKDLLDDIAMYSRNVDQLAFTASQIELRQMHNEQKELRSIALDTRRLMIEHQTLNFRGLLDSKRRICEIQFSQILSFVGNTNLLSPEENFRYACFLSNRHRLRRNNEDLSLWRSKKLQDWASNSDSSLVLVKGSSMIRHELKDFATEAVKLLRNVKVPVVWALRPVDKATMEYNQVDILKQLVHQILQLNHSLLDDQSPALSAARFQSASTEEQWFDLLASVLAGLPRVYIVVDSGLFENELAGELSWPSAFLEMTRLLKIRCPRTTVKVLFVSYGATPTGNSILSDVLEDSTIRVQKGRRHVPKISMRRSDQRCSRGSKGRDSEILKPYISRESADQDQCAV